MESIVVTGIRNRWIIWCFLVISTVAGAAEKKVNSVEIIKLTVPHSIENGTKDFALLDCEYSLKDNRTLLLEVTWFHNDHNIIYKWIPGHSKRQFLGILEGRVDEGYTVSNVPWQKYRGLKILKPTTEFSGKYTCDISTEEGHATEGSSLIVYTKPKKYEVELKVSPEHVNVSCWANGVYPEAKLSLSYKNVDQIKMTEVVEESSLISGAYDVQIHGFVDRKSLVSPTMFNCDIKIPNTSYLVRKDVMFTGRRIREDGSEEDIAHRLESGIAIILITIITHFIINH